MIDLVSRITQGEIFDAASDLALVKTAKTLLKTAAKEIKVSANHAPAVAALPEVDKIIAELDASMPTSQYDEYDDDIPF